MSGSPARVFVSHLSGKPVFDPDGDRVGRIRDVVVNLRPGRQSPRVLGMVIEVQARRRIFLPMTRVTSIDGGEVVTTGIVNMRRFEQRSTETLVLSELLDRRVTLVDSGEQVTVLDIAMERTTPRDWTLAKLFVRRSGHGLRRGPSMTVPWDAVTGFAVTEEAQGAAALVATFENVRPADVASTLHHLSAKRRAEVAAALTDERLADVLEELPEDDQVEILSALPAERAADILEAMDPDDAADLLAEMSTDDAERLLAMMEPDEAEPVRRLLVYSDDTAGGLMTTEPIVLPPDASVGEALARVRNPDLTPALASQVYVCRPPTETPTGRYIGIVHIQRLLREPPFSLIGGIVDTDLPPLSPDAPLVAVTSLLAAYNLVAVPVVDPDNHLLGAITVDDVLDHLLPEDWREGAEARQPTLNGLGNGLANGAGNGSGSGDRRAVVGAAAPAEAAPGPRGGAHRAG